MRSPFRFSLAVLITVGVAISGEAKFAVMPSAVNAGNGQTIAFAVDGKTDVEVAVLDARGVIVRRLAAGVLGGEKVPPEPLKPGLSQSLIWDGKDDFGKAAEGGPFKVRVRAGLGVKFGRLIGGEPCVFGTLSSMAADESGNLYVMGHGANRNQDFRVLRVFDSEGRYCREVMPFPANLAPGAMKDVATWNDERKTFVPRNVSSLNPEFYSLGHLTLVSASSKDGVILSDGTSIFALDANGGVPGTSFTSQQLWPKNGAIKNSGGGPIFLAASPDGKYVYLSGPFSAKTPYGHAYDPKFAPGRIYRMILGAGGEETMQTFATVPVSNPEIGAFELKPNVPGGAWMKVTRNHQVAEGPVHGVAVDSKGNVYVADREHQCVTIFDDKGKEVGKIDVPYPHQIAIHPQTGHVYVLSRNCLGYWQYGVTVTKFKDFAPGAAALAKYEFPKQKTALPQMALVAAEKETSVYVAGVPGNLVCLADKGSSFELKQSAFTAPSDALDVFNRMEVDKTRDDVYVSDGGNMFWRFDGMTGEGTLLKKDGKTFNATDVAAGYDGLLYFQTGTGFSGPLERFTRDLNPAPYPSGTHVLSKYIYGRYGIGNCEKGIGVGPDGKVFSAWMFGGWVKYAVSAWDADGKPLNGKFSDIDPANTKGGTPAELTKAFIGPIPQCNGGVRVDLKGNIYVGMIAGKPSVPKEFEKNDAYRHCTGSVVKFGPEGGSVPGKPDQMVGNTVDGALACYSGLAPFSHPPLATTCCVCRVPRFDVDDFGRLVIPNATANLVTIQDNSGNEIVTFGKYGNFDSQYVNPDTKQGKDHKPSVATPEIPLAWPNSAGITEKHVYVMDVYNRRVVRVDKTYALEAIVDLK